jgi:hypothetical protein
MPKSKDWIEGYLTALYDFAWWADGTMYVGSGVYTYQEIKDNILKENGMVEK